MAFIYGDRVKETSTTSGLGTFTLTGAALGFRTFAAGIGTGNNTFYVIEHDTANTWEVGIGTVTGALLSRDSIINSSSGGAKVNFTAGNKTVRGTVSEDFFNNALDQSKHDALNHSGLPGVPAAEVFTQTVHDTLISHAGLPGVPAPEAFTQVVHDAHDHQAGVNGVPPFTPTATAGSGGAVEGTVSADTDKGLNIVGGVAEVKVDGATVVFNGSGQLQSTEIFDSTAHSTTDHSLIPTHPTATGNGSNIEALVADKVLTNSDPTYQFLTPSGAERKVTLPAVAGANPAFFIVNEGRLLLQVVDAANKLITWLSSDEGVRVIPSGGSWAASSIEKFARPFVGQHYSWGGSPATNNFFLVHRNAAEGGEEPNSNDVGAYHVVHAAGTIDEISWIMVSTNAFETLEIYVNDVVQTVTPTGAGTRFTTLGGGGIANGGRGFFRLPSPISVAQGDRIAIRVRGSGVNQMHVTVRVRTTTDGYRIDFGGNVQTLDAFYDLCGQAGDVKNNLSQDIGNTVVLVGNGSLTSIAYSITGADTGDSVDILINGFQNIVPLSSGVIVNGALVGVETFSLAFSDGDTLAVRANDEVNMNNATLSILTNVPGQAHQYKGNPGADACYQAWNENSGAAGRAFTDNDSRSLSRRRGRVRISWNVTNPPTEIVVISKNMRETHGIDWTSGTQGTEVTSFLVEVGDDIGVCSDTGVEGNSNILVVVGT